MPVRLTETETNATVLVIDDSPENRYVVRRALTRAGMEVLEAGTGAEGTRLARADPDEIDLVILDVNLPDTTGFELCRDLKLDPLTAHVPVIHLSQSAVDDGSRVRGLEGGADAYLTDPVHGSVLVATVRALLRMRKAEDELRRQAEDDDRLIVLNSRLASATSERDVVDALLRSLTTPYTVRRAFLFDARPWLTRPALVYPTDRDVPEGPLPLELEQVDQLIGEIMVEDTVHANRLVYGDPGPLNPYAWTLIPLIAYEREMGALLVEFDEGIELPERNQARLGTAAGRVAEALERARMFEEQRAIALDLQASLLPTKLARIGGLSIAGEYRAGAEGMVVGGDFYDVFSGAGGAWGALIGDVCGRGAAAAARTSLARYTAREAARQDCDPARVLAALERAIDEDRRNDALDLITAVCLCVTSDEDGIAVRCAIAGHPLPILIRADGQVEQIGEPGPILGINPAATFTNVDLRLNPGDVLFLYTDGVIEARRSGFLFGEQRLMDLLAEMVAAGAPVSELASAPVAAAAAYNEVHDDDMATLVLCADPVDPGVRPGGPPPAAG